MHKRTIRKLFSIIYPLPSVPVRHITHIDILCLLLNFGKKKSIRFTVGTLHRTNNQNVNIRATNVDISIHVVLLFRVPNYTRAKCT